MLNRWIDKVNVHAKPRREGTQKVQNSFTLLLILHKRRLSEILIRANQLAASLSPASNTMSPFLAEPPTFRYPTLQNAP